MVLAIFIILVILLGVVGAAAVVVLIARDVVDGLRTRRPREAQGRAFEVLPVRVLPLGEESHAP